VIRLRLLDIGQPGLARMRTANRMGEWLSTSVIGEDRCGDDPGFRTGDQGTPACDVLVSRSRLQFRSIKGVLHTVLHTGACKILTRRGS
jgi:hypothetical protein